MKKTCFFIFMLFCVFPPNQSLADNIVVAVRAHSGIEKATSRWLPTLNYLQKSLPQYHFILLPVEGIKEMEEKVEANQIDFVITQPVAYVDLERLYHVTRILTLQKKYGTRFGSVIFTSINKKNIQTLADLKGKNIAAVTQKGFGGWLIAYNELLSNGIDPYKDCQTVEFLGSHENVVEAVVDGKIDVGIVRTGIIEKMSRNKELSPARIKILNRQNKPDFPPLLSTRLYPEWAFAKTTRVSESIAKKVAIALLAMPPNHLAAQKGRYQQWTIPLSYQPVHDLMKKLHIGSYSEYGKISLTEFISKYTFEVIIFFFLFIIAAFFIFKFTLLKRSEQKLANEQEKLLVTLRSIADGVITTDLAGKIVLINKITEQITGWKQLEAVGRPLAEVFNIINEKNGIPCENPVDKVLASGKIVGLANHTALIARDGTRYSIEDSGAPIFDKEGKIIGTVLVFRDVTEARKTENDLIISEKKYKILTENIPLKLFHKDTESVYVACNKNYASDLNIKADQIAGKTDFDFFPPELADKYRSDDRRIMESQKIGTLEERYISPEGQEAVVQIIRTPIWDEDNKVTGLLGAFIDVTELQMAKNDLRKSEEKFKRLIESLQESHFFYSHDTQGHFTYLSPSITKVLRYSEQEFLTHYTRYLTDNPINKEAKRHTELSIQGIKQQPYEVEFFHKNGGVRQLQIVATPVFGSDGKVMAIEGMAQDITASKRIEAQLRQAQKMEAIGTLAGGIAHDFNNILGVILGYADLAKDDAPPDSKFAGDLDNVLEAGNRAKDLVKQILAFSRQSKVERIPIQLQSLIKEALKMLRSSIPTTIEIHDTIDPRCGVVLADPTQVHQILMNLCTNANHAMEESGGILKIELKSLCIDKGDRQALHIEPGEYVELIVSDTGCGIGPDVTERIFDPYFTTKEPGKGTGMGLAIIHGIIADYGGIITVKSELGKGATFQVYFPVIEQEELPVIKDPEVIPFGKERILFIDDEELLAEMGKEMLERLGYSVTVRQNSLEALATFQNCPDDFDIIITDQTMPGMTGSDLARRMLQIRPDIPIILCTGYSNLIDEETAKSLGIKEFAMKPLTKGKIAKLLRKVLDA